MGSFVSGIIIFYSIHAIVSIALAFLAWLLMPAKYRKSPVRTISFLFIVSMGLVFAGYIGILMLCIALRKQKKMEISSVKTLPLREHLQRGIKTQVRRFGEASMLNLINNVHIPEENRLKALVVMSDIKTSNALSVFRERLGDPQDGVRLFAFSIIQKLEKEINDQIHLRNEELKRVHGDKEKAKIYKKLAELYWELVFLGGGDDVFQEYMFGESMRYAELAHEFISNDPSLLVMLGRLYLKKGELDKSYECFKKAVACGVDEDKVVPYMSELLYRKRDFAGVKNLMTKHPYIRLNPIMYPVINIWTR